MSDLAMSATNAAYQSERRTFAHRCGALPPGHPTNCGRPSINARERFIEPRLVLASESRGRPLELVGGRRVGRDPGRRVRTPGDPVCGSAQGSARISRGVRMAGFPIRLAPAGWSRPCTESAGDRGERDPLPHPRRSREWLEAALVECAQCHQVVERRSPVQRHCRECRASLKGSKSRADAARARRSGHRARPAT